jgi:hypothetical protein
MFLHYSSVHVLFFFFLNSLFLQPAESDIQFQRVGVNFELINSEAWFVKLNPYKDEQSE